MVTATITVNSESTIFGLLTRRRSLLELAIGSIIESTVSFSATKWNWMDNWMMLDWSQLKDYTIVVNFGLQMEKVWPGCRRIAWIGRPLSLCVKCYTRKLSCPRLSESSAMIREWLSSGPLLSPSVVSSGESDSFWDDTTWNVSWFHLIRRMCSGMQGRPGWGKRGGFPGKCWLSAKYDNFFRRRHYSFSIFHWLECLRPRSQRWVLLVLCCAKK